MKQTAGLLIALAGSSPALADGLGTGDFRPRSDGVPSSSVAGAQDFDAALAEGRSLLAAGNAAQAISAFRTAMGQDNQSVAALNGIAIAYDRLGRIDLARQHFETALSLEPEAADIAYNLGWTLHRAGKHREAIAWLQRASGGNDGRAAAAARRALLLVAAAIEAGAAAAPPANFDAPVRVASARLDAARIDMASSGEAVLVLPGSAAHPASASRPVVSAAMARLAGGIPVARAAAGLAVSLDNAPLAAALTPAGLAPSEAATEMAGALGDLAALTIPMVAVTAAKDAGPATTLLPQVITVGDAPPEFSLGLDAALPTLPSLASLYLAPLRLLDLAALPELATAAPAAPRGFLPATLIAVDWLSGFDASRFVDDAPDRAHRRLKNALMAQADPGSVDDKDALRFAIARLEALVNRIGSLNA